LRLLSFSFGLVFGDMIVEIGLVVFCTVCCVVSVYYAVCCELLNDGLIVY